MDRRAPAQGSPRSSRRSGGSSRRKQRPSPSRPAILSLPWDLPSPLSLPSFPPALTPEVERRGAELRALRGPGTPDWPSGACGAFPGARAGLAPSPGPGSSSPPRAAATRPVSSSPERRFPRLLPLLPPPPRAHALPHPASCEPGSNRRRIPARSLALPGFKFTQPGRGLPRLPDPGGVARSPHARPAGVRARAHAADELRALPQRPARSLLLARGLAVPCGLGTTRAAQAKKWKGSWAAASKHLRQGRLARGGMEDRRVRNRSSGEPCLPTHCGVPATLPCHLESLGRRRAHAWREGSFS